MNNQMTPREAEDCLLDCMQRDYILNGWYFDREYQRQRLDPCDIAKLISTPPSAGEKGTPR